MLTITLPAAELSKALALTLPFAAKPSEHEILASVNLRVEDGAATLYATDRYALSRYRIALDDPHVDPADVTLTAESAKALMRTIGKRPQFLDVTLTVDPEETEVRVRYGRSLSSLPARHLEPPIVGPTIERREGNYPNLTKLWANVFGTKRSGHALFGLSGRVLDRMNAAARALRSPASVAVWLVIEPGPEPTSPILVTAASAEGPLTEWAAIVMPVRV